MLESMECYCHNGFLCCLFPNDSLLTSSYESGFDWMEVQVPTCVLLVGNGSGHQARYKIKNVFLDLHRKGGGRRTKWIRGFKLMRDVLV